MSSKLHGVPSNVDSASAGALLPDWTRIQALAAVGGPIVGGTETTEVPR
jgi:hypothetical protein